MDRDDVIRSCFFHMISDSEFVYIPSTHNELLLLATHPFLVTIVEVTASAAVRTGFDFEQIS